jgi:hypothetical protein
MNPKRMANDAELKEVIKAIADSELLVSEVVSGFSFSEITQLISVLFDLPPIVQNGAIEWPEFKDLDDAARADLIAYVQAECKFPDSVSAEQWVQKVLQAIILVSSFFTVSQKSKVVVAD